MPVRMEVIIIGGDRLRGWLARAPEEFRAGLFAATTRAVEIEARAIRDDTPELTGKMKGSWGTKVKATADGVEGEVYSTDTATRFVEFGTRQHGRAQRMAARGTASTRPAVKGLFQASVGKVAGTFGNL